MAFPDNIQPRAGEIFEKAKATYLRLGSTIIPDCLDAAGRREYQAGVNAAKLELGEDLETQTSTQKESNQMKLSKEDSQRLNAEIQAGNKSVKVLAEEFGISVKSIYARIYARRNKSTPKREITDEDINAAIDAHYPTAEPDELETPSDTPEEPEYIDESEPETPESDEPEIEPEAPEYTQSDLLIALGNLLTILGGLLKK